MIGVMSAGSKVEIAELAFNIGHYGARTGARAP